MVSLDSTRIAGNAVSPHRCGGGCEESAMTTANEKGSRDTGSDLPSGGSADRPSGTYEGDESMPQGI